MSTRTSARLKSSTKADPEEHPESAPAHRKRGRDPKGGPTTKITGADAAAAEQLENELTTEVGEAAKPQRKRKRAEHPPVASASDDGKNYWLMKAEQEDREVTAHSGKTINTKFTIDDLEARTEPEPWDGVRNVVARNNMRAMKKGDLAFFYASGGSGKLKPGITGIMEVVKEHEADFTVDDEDAYGYVEPGKRGTADKPQWSLVHVEFRKKLSAPVALKKLQEHAGAGQPLQGMQVLTNSRVSVSKVNEKQWTFILDELIQEVE
ncbi:hypothetical protein AMS68_003025 [Peltaster fructicola]|uniref:EVE domain-containing protein n=1 Tax=Peltaster fructicola TaxID=286661 RepID=A0A6H0XSA6_9PEZI|nr:hypothetical protein AMS68_003025 [Peltaster fructicola]